MMMMMVEAGRLVVHFLSFGCLIDGCLLLVGWLILTRVLSRSRKAGERDRRGGGQGQSHGALERRLHDDATTAGGGCRSVSLFFLVCIYR